MSIDSVGSSSVYEDQSFSEEDLKRIESLEIEWRGRSVVEVYDDLRIQVILTAAATYFQTAQQHPEQIPKLNAEIIDLVSDVLCEDEDDDIDISNPFYQYDPVSGTYHRVVAVEKIHLGKAWRKVKEKTKKISKKAEHVVRKAKHAVVKVVDKTKEIVENAVDWAKEHGSANVQGPSTSYGPPESSKGHSKPSAPPPTPKSNSPLAQRQPDFIQKPSLTPQNTPPIALPKGMPQNHYDPNPYQQSGYPHRNLDLKPGAGHFSPPNLPTGHVPQHYIAPAIKPGEEPSVQQVIGTQSRAVDFDPSKLDEEKLEEEEDLASARAMNTLPANDRSVSNPGGSYKTGSAAAEGSLIGTQQQNTQLQESNWMDRLDKTAHELGAEPQSRLARAQDPSWIDKLDKKAHELGAKVQSNLAHVLLEGVAIPGKMAAALGDAALSVGKPLIPDADLQKMESFSEKTQRTVTSGHQKIDDIFGTTNVSSEPNFSDKLKEAESAGMHSLWKNIGIIGKNSFKTLEKLNPSVGPKRGKSLSEAWETLAVPYVHEKIDQAFSTNIKDEFDPKKDGKLEQVVANFLLDPVSQLQAGRVEEVVNIAGHGLSSAAQKIKLAFKPMTRKAGGLEPALAPAGNVLAKEGKIIEEGALVGNQSKAAGKASILETPPQKVLVKTETALEGKTIIGTKLKLEGLLQAGLEPDRAGFTRAGRALMKHGNREGSVFPKPAGNADALNERGQKVLEMILNHPEKQIIHVEFERYGKIIDIQAPGIGGARYSADGKFIGFLEPEVK